MPAISRWLSAAIPPVLAGRSRSSTPAGVAAPLVKALCCDPFRVGGQNVTTFLSFRGYRCAQPPANSFDPSRGRLCSCQVPQGLELLPVVEHYLLAFPPQNTTARGRATAGGEEWFRR